MTLSIAHKHLRNLLNDFDNADIGDVLLELQFSSLIVAFSRSIGFPIIDNKFIPLFTDLHELRKFDPKGEYQYVDEEYNYYLEILYKLDLSGFIINPCSENIEVSGNLLKPNCHFQFDCEPYTIKEIRQLKGTIENRELNNFLKNKDNLWDKEALIDKLSKSTPYVLLISDKNLDNHAEEGVITKSLAGGIPKCVYELSTSNYLLLFSREINQDCVDYDGFKYAEIANFHQTVDEILSHDFDGFILNIDEENIIISREELRDFVKRNIGVCIDDFSMYAFPVTRGQEHE